MEDSVEYELIDDGLGVVENSTEAGMEEAERTLMRDLDRRRKKSKKKHH